ncbi:unnamed protein product, partial [Polarella glacialis]
LGFKQMLAFSSPTLATSQGTSQGSALRGAGPQLGRGPGPLEVLPAGRGFASAVAAAASGTLALLASGRRRRRTLLSPDSGRHTRQGPAASAEASAGAAQKDAPPILVINLDRSPQRWESCQKEFAREKIKVERFPATDGKTLTKE